jgi:hypothetical protein
VGVVLLVLVVAAGEAQPENRATDAITSNSLEKCLELISFTVILQLNL